jgi:hypothetical protein
MISCVTVTVIKESPNALICLSRAFCFYECIFDYVCAYTVGSESRCALGLRYVDLVQAYIHSRGHHFQNLL